jgi:hypothetical protein
MNTDHILKTFDDLLETFSLSSDDIMNYRSYQRDCIVQTKPYKLFSQWYQELHDKEVPIKLRKAIDSAFEPAKKRKQRG